MTDPKEEGLKCCVDCHAPYGQDDWCDVNVPDEIWNKIAPQGGLLCFRCMTKRIIAAAFTDVPVIVKSGPYADANERWRQSGWTQGYKVAKERIAELEEELASICRLVQRYQPVGSPPPGGLLVLATWILGTLSEEIGVRRRRERGYLMELKDYGETVKRLRDEIAELKKGQIC